MYSVVDDQYGEKPAYKGNMIKVSSCLGRLKLHGTSNFLHSKYLHMISFDIPETLSRELCADPFLDFLAALHHVMLLQYYWNVMQTHVCV